MSDAALYRLTDVTKSHGGPFTLQLPRLEIERGEIFCLLGPTGSGKSTLLRLLAALESPTSGRVDFDGQALHATNVPLAVRRRMTMVFQRPLLLHGTVRHNVEYGLRLRGADDRSAKAQRIMQQLGLSPLETRGAQSLSGGQTQLVALARALTVEPEVLLLDEPTANLDPAHVALVERTIADVHRERHMTIVWATHNLFQARRVAQRVGLLLDGSLIEVAETEPFFEQPTDPRTAAFVRGEMIY